MITTVTINQKLMQLMLDSSAWEGDGLSVESLALRWPQTGLRRSDLTEALLRAAENKWITLEGQKPEHLHVRFTASGFDMATAKPATSVRADRGVGMLMSSLGMKLGIPAPARPNWGADRRHGAARAC